MKCSSCDAEIRWEKTVRGKPIPLDPEPVGGAHLFIDEQGRVADDRTYPAPEGAARFQTHFSSCPSAEKHRRPTKKGEADG